MKRKGPMLIN